VSSPELESSSERVDLPLPAERFDERDAMFSRAALEPGTPAYAAAYARRPELKEVDDAIRRLPELTEPGGTLFDAGVMAETADLFAALERLEVDPTLLAAQSAALREAPEPSAHIARAALRLGAVAAGWAPLEPAFVYSHRGRFAADWGAPVRLDHRHALVFLVEMDFDTMRRAPSAEGMRESARQYRNAARISLHLETLIRAAGFDARHHYDAHYDVILPPLAVLAGLGEIGRNNILIADRFGARVRIGCVTTSMPARLATPRALGVRAFCEICMKCAKSCPSGALTSGDREEVLGAPRWPTRVERCYRYWRQTGTDCGICMACCPFSHPDNALHNLVRRIVRRAPWAHQALVRGDALLYGRRWKPGKGR
jgi:ferredoxin